MGCIQKSISSDSTDKNQEKEDQSINDNEPLSPSSPIEIGIIHSNDPTQSSDSKSIDSNNIIERICDVINDKKNEKDKQDEDEKEIDTDEIEKILDTLNDTTTKSTKKDNSNKGKTKNNIKDRKNKTTVNKSNKSNKSKKENAKQREKNKTKKKQFKPKNGDDSKPKSIKKNKIPKHKNVGKKEKKEIKRSKTIGIAAHSVNVGKAKPKPNDNHKKKTKISKTKKKGKQTDIVYAEKEEDEELISKTIDINIVEVDDQKENEALVSNTKPWQNWNIDTNDNNDKQIAIATGSENICQRQTKKKEKEKKKKKTPNRAAAKQQKRISKKKRETKQSQTIETAIFDVKKELTSKSKPKPKPWENWNIDTKNDDKKEQTTNIAKKKHAMKRGKTIGINIDFETECEEKKGNKEKFPWSNWEIDTNKKDKNKRKRKRPERRSSLGSVRELAQKRIKKKKKTANAMDAFDISPDNELETKRKKNRKKKKKKIKKNELEHFDVDIYSPQSLKTGRKKEKKKKKYKVIPKHRIRRSSLPTYDSIKKNNPELIKNVIRESNRDLSTLLDQPQKRKQSKKLKNLSRNGFEIHINHRYKLVDGRIGVCKYRGRTVFGKSSEDWIGLVVDVGDGEHNGTVKGKCYFRCRDGKGLFVRPYDIIKDMGSHNKLLNKNDVKLAKHDIKRFKKKEMESTHMTTSSVVISNDEEGNAINPDHGYNMLNEKYFNSKTLLDKNKGMKVDKKNRHFQV